MQKTVKVVDEVGNRYEATYVKRAKGLVKNGRARFIDEDTICLVRPPNNTEDIKMTDINKNEALVETALEKAELPEAIIETTPSKYTLEYALEQIEMIARDNEYILQAFDVLTTVESVGPGDIGAEEKSKAIGNTIKARETTNQQLIKFYEKIVDDLKPKSEFDENREYLKWVKECMAVSDRPVDEYAKFWKSLKEMNK